MCDLNVIAMYLISLSSSIDYSCESTDLGIYRILDDQLIAGEKFLMGEFGTPMSNIIAICIIWLNHFVVVYTIYVDIHI